MSSSTVRSPEAVPTPVSFSYAQAAKGRTPSTTTTPATQPSQTTSGVSTPHKETLSTSVPASVSSERGAGGINGIHEGSNGDDAHRELSTTQQNTISQSKSISSPTSPSFDTVSTSTVAKESQEDDFTTVGGSSSDLAKDKHSPANNTMEKPAEEKEGRRNKKSKKQKNAEKEAEKEKEEVKPENLVPAPIPTVNFWSQRKEEAAKAKPVPLPVHGLSSSDVPAVNEVKAVDSKRSAKPTGGEEEEKTMTTHLNGVAKESSNTNRSQKRGNDNANKSKEEQGSKRAGPRGSRGAEKDDKSANNQLPPPVEDAISWPTPETALEEEKRKAQEKSEKDEKEDSNSVKQPRPKEKWVTVPYIPTVTFSTPLPPRGGRGRGGARGGRTEAGGRSGNAGNAAVSGEKAAPTSSAVAPGSSGESGDSKDSTAQAASLPPNANRHPEQSTSRNQRKGATTTGADRPKSDSTKNTGSTGLDARNSISIDPLDTSFQGQDNMARSSESKVSKQDQLQGNFGDGQSTARSNRQSDQTQRASDAGRENGQASRDRSDGRSDRGRGGFRGRGGHNTFSNGQHPAHAFANGHPAQPPNGYPIRQNSVSSPYSPPLQQMPFSNQYAPPPTRGGRGGSARSQSIPNRTMYRHFGPNGGPSPQHMAPIQTSNPVFDYPMQPMSSGPFTPYTESISLFTLVTMQLEYYFSIDNLCKDVYLRKHMDGQGYVHLTFIAGFKRIQSLTQEFELLKYACQESEIIDLVRGSDGVDRLRRKEGWEKWVLAVEERDPLARNPGPEYVLRPFPPQRQQPMQPMMAANHPPMSPPPFSPNGTEQNYRPYVNGTHGPPVVNGNGVISHPETPLSAAVPDFAPGLLPTAEIQDPLEAEVTFNDEEVANLTLVFASPKGNEDQKPKVPFHNSPSRTFSNGSIDGRSIAEEIQDGGRQSRALNNGSHASESHPEDLGRSRSPFGPLSPTRSTTSNSPPVMWVKGQRQQEVSEHNTEELYTDFRARALKKRELSAHGETHADMKLLYEFWSHFLCRNFNLTMYNEFRKYAFEDLRAEAPTGNKSLVSYYDEVLNSKKKVIPETLARHYIEIVQNEEGIERPAFDKLRAAWRNGALDLKSRKKIDNLIAPQLREELEQAPHARSSA